MATATTIESAAALADRVAGVYATYEGAEEVFAPDVLFDINVPTWRFQVEGAKGFLDWLRGESPSGYGIRVLRVAPTSTGFAMELEGEHRSHGHDLFFRNLILCEVHDGLVTEVLFYCTGDWDEDTRARQAAEAPMVRR